MNELLSAAILGIVEGVTEFLPISSTGHLIVAGKVLGIKDTSGSFELIIQLGAVLAVIWFYRRDLYQHFLSFKTKKTKQFIFNLILAFVPAAIFGFLFGEFIKQKIFTTFTVAISLIVGGIILWLVENAIDAKKIKTDIHEIDKIRGRNALQVGLAQVFSLIPGVSRSGATIIGGLLSGIDRKTAISFSFYLSIPTLGIATLYDLFKNINTVGYSIGFAPLVVGLLTSFFTSLIFIGWLLRFISKNNLRMFAIYRVIAGIFILIFVR